MRRALILSCTGRKGFLEKLTWELSRKRWIPGRKGIKEETFQVFVTVHFLYNFVFYVLASAFTTILTNCLFSSFYDPVWDLFPQELIGKKKLVKDAAITVLIFNSIWFHLFCLLQSDFVHRHDHTALWRSNLAMVFMYVKFWDMEK